MKNISLRNIITNWDKYLLENYPIIWETRIHYFIFWSIFFVSPLVFISGFLYGFEKEIYNFSQIFTTTQILFWSLFSIFFIFYIFWQNILCYYIKYYYNAQQIWAIWGSNFFIFVLCWINFMLFPFGIYTNIAMRYNIGDIKKEAIYLTKANIIYDFLWGIKKNDDTENLDVFLKKLSKMNLQEEIRILKNINYERSNETNKKLHQKLKYLKNIHSFLDNQPIHIDRVNDLYDIITKDVFASERLNGNTSSEDIFLKFIANEKYFNTLVTNALATITPYISIPHNKIISYEHDRDDNAPENVFSINNHEVLKNISNTKTYFITKLFLEFILPFCFWALFAVVTKNYTFQHILLSICTISLLGWCTIFFEKINEIALFNIFALLSVLVGCNLSKNLKNPSLVFSILSNMVFVSQIINFIHLCNATKINALFGDLILIVLGFGVMWGIYYLQNEYKVFPKK